MILYAQVLYLCLLRVCFEMDTKSTFAQSIDNVWNMWEGNKEDAWHRLISRRPLGAIYGQTCQSWGSFWSFSIDKDLGSSVQFKILRTWQFPWKQQSRSYQDCKWSKSDFNHVGLTAACIKRDYFFTVLLPPIKNMIFVIQKCKHNIALRLSLWVVASRFDRLRQTFKNIFNSYDYLQALLRCALWKSVESWRFMCQEMGFYGP